MRIKQKPRIRVCRNVYCMQNNEGKIFSSSDRRYRLSNLGSNVRFVVAVTTQKNVWHAFCLQPKFKPKDIVVILSLNVTFQGPPSQGLPFKEIFVYPLNFEDPSRVSMHKAIAHCTGLNSLSLSKHIKDEMRAEACN